MRIIFALVFLVGLGIAGFAVFMTMERFAEIEAKNVQLANQARGLVATKPVLLASAELKFGQRLLAEHVKEVLFPVAAIPENAFTDIEELIGTPDDLPRTVTRTVEVNEVIMRSKVTNFGESAGVSSRLRPGMRAFTISVDLTSGVSGFLKPGDNVDIYWSGQVSGVSSTRLLLENVPLIAIDQNADEDAARPTIARSVTVEVTPQVVAALTQARNSGKLTLALRGAEESQILGELEVNQSSLLGIEDAAVAAPEKVCTQRTRRGVDVVVTVVPCTD